MVHARLTHANRQLAHRHTNQTISPGRQTNANQDTQNEQTTISSLGCVDKAKQIFSDDSNELDYAVAHFVSSEYGLSGIIQVTKATSLYYHDCYHQSTRTQLVGLIN